MDPDPIPLFLLVVTFSLYGVMVAIEIAFVMVDQSLIHTQSMIGNHRAQSVDALLKNPSLLLITTTLLKNISALMALGVLIHSLAAGLALSNMIGVLLLVGLLLALLQTMLHTWATSRATSIVLQFASLIRLLVFCFQPVTTLFHQIHLYFFDSAPEIGDGTVFLNHDRLKWLLDARQHDNVIPENEWQMIESILELEGTTVREVMVPRIDMITLDIHTTLRQALDTIIDAGHSRIPVFEENVDHIVGILYAKDLLHCLHDQRTDIIIREQLRPVFYVPSSKKLPALFQEMQKQRVHIAMVVDEYGGTAGLVTIEDLLEEIVGEIQDEYDPDEESLVEAVDSEAYILSARLHIDDLAELLDIAIEEEHVDTLGGLIFRLAGHVPTEREMVEFAGWRFIVQSLDGNKIKRVRAEAQTHKNNSTQPILANSNTSDTQHRKKRSVLTFE